MRKTEGGGGDLLAIGEAARLLGVSATRMRQLTDAGRLSAMRVGGRRVYRRADVERLKRQREKATR